MENKVFNGKAQVEIFPTSSTGLKAGFTIGLDHSETRQAYRKEVEAIKITAQKLMAGKGTTQAALAEIAKTVYEMRAALKIKYLLKTSEGLTPTIKERNEAVYGNSLGPSFDFLIGKYQGNYLAIIEAACRPNQNLELALFGEQPQIFSRG